MKVNLNIINISLVLIFLGVFFLPFNSWEGISILGEYHRDASVLFFLTAFIKFGIRLGLSLPLHSPIFYLLIIFLI